VEVGVFGEWGRGKSIWGVGWRLESLGSGVEVRVFGEWGGGWSLWGVG
jgi:hypothetical protein